MSRVAAFFTKFFIYMCLFLSLLFMVSCAEKPEPIPEENLVYIVENDLYTVENNGELVAPGKSVRFSLMLPEGYSVTGTDYQGEYRVWQSGKHTYVELKSVQYPTRVELKYTSKYRVITYDVNGGTPVDGIGSSMSITYDISLHTRPNTSTGVYVFYRDGYTLESWNTKADGTGDRIGLGSRVSVGMSGLTLYAQWAKWTDAGAFTYTDGEQGLTITGCSSSDATLVVPMHLDGRPVTAIASGAFNSLPANTVILSPYLQTIEEGAFINCNFSSIVIYDNIVTMSDGAFDSAALSTLYINAVEPPYGYVYRRESMYADKIDMLINAQGEQKMVFYSGCSVWYNLDSATIKAAFGDKYKIINLGLNGTLNSWVQMEIMTQFMEEGDLLIHSPELSSATQFMDSTAMTTQETMLWCGIENNYDLFAYVDISRISGVFDSLCYYLSKKNKETTYDTQRYTQDGNPYIDDIGCIPFERTETSEKLLDTVRLNVDKITNRNYDLLQECYTRLSDKGVRIYITYAVLNVDALPEDQKGNVMAANAAFSEVMANMEGVVLISQLGDFLYHSSDFYDTNYHLLSKQAVSNTYVWIRDIRAQLKKDGN